MKFKGVNTSTAGDKFLCRTCEHGLIMKGASGDQEKVLCNYGAEIIDVGFHVIECTGYRNKAVPSLYDMEKIAWVLVTDKKATKVGFVSAKEWKRQQANKDDDPLDDVPKGTPGMV
jgi:hypothetical protein